MALDEPAPPDATYVKRRWVPHHRAKWAKECADILREHGAVTSQTRYPIRHRARWRAQYLIEKLVELDHFQRWELREHTNQTEDGWTWTVERIARDSQ